MLLAGTSLLLAACTGLPRPGRAVDAGTLVGLEARFAAVSRERGARAAFLEFLADDAIVLQPGPVYGRAAWEAAEELPGTLDWAPDWVGMAADGALGFATGPWQLTPAGTDAPAVEGRYLTVWRRDGATWRVVFDGGFGRRPGATPQPAEAGAGRDGARCEPGPVQDTAALQALDTALSGTGFEPHAVRVAGWLAEEAALFLPPDIGGARDARARQDALAALPGTTQLWPMGGAVAGSGDIGYTYGLSAPALDAEADAAYANVWCRRGGAWQLLLALRASLGG
jgi:ketosteroid isomerase-like protein